MSVSRKPLHVDIPVQLKDVKTVYSIDALAFEGDLPASIFHLQLTTNGIADANAKSKLRHYVCRGRTTSWQLQSAS